MPIEPLPPAAATLLEKDPSVPSDATIQLPRGPEVRPSDEAAAADSLPRIALDGDLAAGSTSRDADLELVRVLGEGGRGRVMLARQRSIGREVAVKVARDRELGSAALRVEARTMGRLEHPNIVPVHAIGRDEEGDVVLVMKHIEGVEWRALLQDPDATWWDRLGLARGERTGFHVDVLAHVANALHYAHARGVIHRDVKPENVLIGADGDVYLADWGVASLPQEREAGAPVAVVGTPAYMAPELVFGDPTQVSVRTDVYLLGATLHEILTGKPPHAADSVSAALVSAFASRVPAYPDDVPEELAALATWATSREPSARPASALAFRRALDTWRVHRGAVAIGDRARALVTEARALRASGGAEALAEVDRKLVEARFGFTEALREWPEWEVAREGLREVLVLAVESEVARRSVRTARARLSEIEDPPRELVAAVEALEARHTADLVERERLEAMDRDRDISVASSGRRAFFAVVLTTTALITCFAFIRRELTGERPMSEHVNLVGVAAIVLAAATAFALVMRRRRAQNTAGAALLLAVLASMVAVLANRLVGWIAETPVHALLAADCLIYGTMLVAARANVPRLSWLAIGHALGAVGCAVLPQHAASVFALTNLAVLTIIYASWQWFMRVAPPKPIEDARPRDRGAS